MAQYFSRHVYAVQRYIEFTSPRYSPLMKAGVAAHPVCCFGDVETARVVTVGLNPSVGEFTKANGWPVKIEHEALASRCSSYFSKSETRSPHGWFKPWSEGLERMGVNYADGSVVHLDLSPRPTRFVSEMKDEFERTLFLEMVERDLWTFFATLSRCPKASVVLVAGTVTGRFYINEYLQRYAPQHGWALDGAFSRVKHPGKAKVCWHELNNGERRLPVFFCSSSPSDRDKSLLPARIKENSARLKSIITRCD